MTGLSPDWSFNEEKYTIIALLIFAVLLGITLYSIHSKYHALLDKPAIEYKASFDSFMVTTTNLKMYYTPSDTVVVETTISHLGDTPTTIEYSGAPIRSGLLFNQSEDIIFQQKIDLPYSGRFNQMVI